MPKLLAPPTDPILAELRHELSMIADGLNAAVHGLIDATD